MRNLKVLGMVLLLLTLASSLSAEVPALMNYQGRLTDNVGSPLNGTYSISFVLYDDSTGGAPFWNETHPALEVTDGMFSVVLGETSDLYVWKFHDPDCWMSIKVGSDAPITPRTRITAVPYSLITGSIHGAEGGPINGHVDIFGNLTVVGTANLGYGNEANGYSAIAGGVNDTVIGDYSAVMAGQHNVVTSNHSVISGGKSNIASNLYTTVSGGNDNEASAYGATVCGGYGNLANGRYSIAVGGQYNSAEGDYSFASGYHARAVHDGCFVWADDNAADFTSSGPNQFLIRASSGVGIGITTPATDLDVDGNIMARGTLRSGWTGYSILIDGPNSQITTNSGQIDFVDADLFTSGNVGIGTTTPNDLLEITDANGAGITLASDVGQTAPRITIVNADNPQSTFLTARDGDAFDIESPYGVALLSIETSGQIGIGRYDPYHKLHVEGNLRAEGNIQARDSILAESHIKAGGNLYAADTASAAIVEIRGGADLAEPFPLSELEGTIIPGTIVVIDEKNPGHLKSSYEPYDKKVAGIVSGAGGVNPGITMSQQNVLGGGVEIALSGRAFALADASYGAIVPGDLLTTSGTPGHAMRVSDNRLAPGSVIGKAMTPLREGTGLVLVLVNLQ